MGALKKNNPREVILSISLLALIVSAMLYYTYFFKPKNSLELYQSITFSENFEEVQKLMLPEYVGNFKQEDYEFITKLGNIPTRISQFTLFEYHNKTIMVLTSPGTKKLKILMVDELPEEVKNYFIEVLP